MVGEGYGGCAVFSRPATEPVHATGAVQEGVLRVNVEMNELRQPTMPGLKKTKQLDVTLNDGH
jgi:hypothetical protein